MNDTQKRTPTIKLVGGIEGLQAYSTQVVTENIKNQLLKLGFEITCLTYKPKRIPKGTLQRWLMELITRYFTYPRWCAKQISHNDIVYITDHANAPVINFLSNRISVISHCHDLTSLRPLRNFPYKIRLRNRLIHYASLLLGKKRGLLKADWLVAISAYTKSEICRFLDYASEKIEVIHLGVDHATYYPENTDKAREQLNLPKDIPVFMTVGPSSYRKNLIVAAQMLIEYQKVTPDFRWLHVGQLSERVLKLAHQGGFANKIITFSRLSDSEMRMAYNSASVFLFPSLYEGFGLPPLEAMACGTAVLAADIPVTHEVLGTCARFFPPQDSQSMLTECIDIVENPPSKQTLIQHASEFTWEKTGQKVANLILKNIHKTNI
jgi:glycosyltransferase involved in cell wall biosynthesis